MIFRGVVLTVLLVTVLLLETVVGPALRVGGVAPKLVAVSVLAVGMIAGSTAGLVYGFAAGIAVGVLQGPESILGVAALLLLLGGYAVGLARPFIAASELPAQVVLGAVGVVALTLAEELFEVLLGRQTVGLGRLLVDALVGGLYAALLTPLVCLLVSRMERALPQSTG